MAPAQARSVVSACAWINQIKRRKQMCILHAICGQGFVDLRNRNRRKNQKKKKLALILAGRPATPATAQLPATGLIITDAAPTP